MSAATDRFRDSLILPTIRNASRIRFYQELWQGSNPGQVRTAGDLHLLPVMDRLDYQDRLHLFWTREMLDQSFLISHTSGTTGRPMYRYRSKEEVDYISRFFASLHLSSERPSGAGMLVLDATSLTPHGDAIPMPYPHPVLSVPIDTPADLERAADALAAPHRVAGELRFVESLKIAGAHLAGLTSLLARRGIDPKETLHVRSIGISSAYVNRAAVGRISAFWGIPVNDRYSLSEIFGGASGCLRCGWHHPDPFVAAEVVDPGTGSPVFRGRGVLVLTELFPFVQTHPFIRYWTGDVVETAPSECAASSVAFRYMGRTSVRCGGATRIPFQLQEKHISQGVLLDEDGTILVCPAPLLDLLGQEPGIAREQFWETWGHGEDRLRLGVPQFALRLQPGRPSVVQLSVPVDQPRELDPTLPARLRAALLEGNPELAARCAAGSVVLDVAVSEAEVERDHRQSDAAWRTRSNPVSAGALG